MTYLKILIASAKVGPPFTMVKKGSVVMSPYVSFLLDQNTAVAVAHESVRCRDNQSEA